jgi:hypothetical protein
MTLDIEFIASAAVITSDTAGGARLYRDALGLPLEAAESDDYLHSGDIPGSPHFGVWPQAWGQTIARLLSDDGVTVGISFVPDFHR